MQEQVPQLYVEFPVNQGQGSKISSNLVKFRKAILEAPINKCFSCKKLYYGRLGGTIAWDEAGKMFEVVSLSVDNGVGKLWFATSARRLCNRRRFLQHRNSTI